MNDINNVTILGRLVRDPEVRFAATGTAVASFSIATNRRYADKSGQWQVEVAFLPCAAFGRVAEQLAQKHKGDAVLATGRLRTENWEKDGAKHSRLVLVTETLHFIASAPTGGMEEAGEPLPAPGEVRKAVPF